MNTGIRIKEGDDLLFNLYYDRIERVLIVNLMEKWNYEGFLQKKNRLFIATDQGKVILAFSGDVPVLEQRSYTKDQIVFNCKYF